MARQEVRNVLHNYCRVGSFTSGTDCVGVTSVMSGDEVSSQMFLSTPQCRHRGTVVFQDCGLGLHHSERQWPVSDRCAVWLVRRQQFGRTVRTASGASVAGRDSLAGGQVGLVREGCGGEEQKDEVEHETPKSAMGCDVVTCR